MVRCCKAPTPARRTGRVSLLRMRSTDERLAPVLTSRSAGRKLLCFRLWWWAEACWLCFQPLPVKRAFPFSPVFCSCGLSAASTCPAHHLYALWRSVVHYVSTIRRNCARSRESIRLHPIPPSNSSVPVLGPDVHYLPLLPARLGNHQPPHTQTRTPTPTRTLARSPHQDLTARSLTGWYAFLINLSASMPDPHFLLARRNVRLPSSPGRSSRMEPSGVE